MPRSTKIPPIRKDGTPRWLYETLRRMNDRLGDDNDQLYAISRGESSFGGGTPLAGVSDHGQLSGLSPDDDHSQYLLLRGRPSGQTAFGSIDTTQTNPWIDSGTSFTTQKRKVDETSWSSIVIDNSAAIGKAIVLVLATHTNGTGSGPTGTTSFHTSITDSKGNTWTKHREYTASLQAGVDEVTVSLWTTVVTSALTAGVDTLTCNFFMTIASKAIESRIFSIPSGSSISLVTSSVSNDTDSDPQSMTLTGLIPGAYLFVRAISFHQDIISVVPGFTPTGGFVPFTTDHTNSSNTSSQASFRNVCSRGEFSATYGTTATSDPTIETSPASFFPDVASIFAALAVTGTVSGLLHLQSINNINASIIRLENSTIYSNFDFFYFRNIGSTTNNSYIRGSDGAFIGPVYPTAFTVPDSAFRISGSSDATKLVAFEVDGLTTATTRTLTVPDVDATLLLTQGTSAGQVIGTNSHTGGSVNSLVIEGAVMLGENLAGVNFTPNQVLFVSSSPATLLTGTTSLARLALGLGSVSTINSTANVRMFEVSATGTPSATSGSIGTLSGFFMNSAVQIPTGVTITNLIAGQFNVSAGSTDTAGISNVIGNQIIANGNLTSSSTGNAFTGLEIQVSPRAQAFTNAYGINIIKSTGSNVGVATNAYGINIASTVFSAATNWIGLNIPVVSGPSLQKGFVIGDMQNSIVGTLELGANSGAIANRPSLYIAPNGTTKNQITLVLSGSLLTSPLAGAIEGVSDDLYFTITTGAARKKIVLDDGTALTAGRVPFATTNGRLTDDADFTFATDTLTITKIAGTQFTGDIQFTGSGVGLPYGSCYGNEIAWTQAAAAASTFYEVSDTDMTDGELNNVTHDGSGKLTATIAGRYLITYSVSLEADAANIHLISAISINGTEISPGRMHFHRAAASAVIPLTGTAVVNLAANDTIEVAVATTDAGTPTLSVDHLNISIVQVGG